MKIEFGIGQIGFVLGLLGDGLVERGLVRTRVDLGQDVTLLHQLPFLEGNLVDLTVHPGPNNHGVERLNRPQTEQIRRKIRLLDRCYRHRNRLG